MSQPRTTDQLSKVFIYVKIINDKIVVKMLFMTMKSNFMNHLLRLQIK